MNSTGWLDGYLDGWIDDGWMRDDGWMDRAYQTAATEHR